MVRDQNALLTSTDREFLHNPDGYYTASSAKQMRSERRSHIRARIRESILDLALLFELYEDHQDLIDDVFSEVHDDEVLADALSDAIALILCGVTSSTSSSGRRLRYIDGPGDIGMFGQIEGLGDHHSEEFLQLLGDGLARGLFKFDNILLEHAELHTETTRLPDVQIQRDLEEGETLHPNAAALLVKSGKIDPEAFSEFAREQLLEEDNGDE